MKSLREEVMDMRSELGQKIDVLSASLGARFEAMNERIDGIDARLIGVEYRLGGVETLVSELQEEIRSALTAYDKDSETILDHEKRVVALEERLNSARLVSC